MDMSPIIAELERMYRESVHRWAPDEEWAQKALSDPPMVTVASRGRKATVLSWYEAGVWRDGDEDILDWLAGSGNSTAEQVKRAEIVIASEVLHDPVQAVAELWRQTLAHVYAPLRPKPGSFYYGSQWGSGWYVPFNTGMATVNPSQPSKGLSRWTPSAGFRQWVDETVRKEVFVLTRDSAAAVKKGSRMKKWQCKPGCTIVRCATRLDATCGKCGLPFKWAEQEADPYNPGAQQKLAS